MSRLALSVVLALLMCMPAGVSGHGLGLLHPRTTVAYYYSVPVHYVPVPAYAVYPVCVPAPAPVYPSVPPPAVPGRTYAPPTAAPPSPGPSTPEPPLASPPAPAPAKPASPSPGRSLGFGESTSFYDAYSVAGQSGSRVAGDRCTVDFWNLTDRDLILRIQGEPPHLLPRGKSVPVTTARQFTWQVEGRDTETTRVDSGESGMQIVIRR